jgi:sarcosine oxidase subunit gamma
VHKEIEALGAHWGEVNGTPLALDFGSPEAEARSARTLGLCDLSALRKLGLKGRGAADWLTAQGIDVPSDTFGARQQEPEGIAVRLGEDECLLESGLSGGPVVALSERFDPAQPNTYRVERQDATFVLTGSSALQVMSQVCGANFAEVTAWRLVYSRVAGVSAALLATPRDEVPHYRIWVDPTVAPYLWGQLFHICQELGGQVVGAQAVC